MMNNKLKESGNEESNTRVKEILNFLDFNGIQQKCPCCGSEHYIKNGYMRDVPRLICKECGANYSMLTNTLFEGTSYTINEVLNVTHELANAALSLQRKALKWRAKNSRLWLMRYKIIKSIIACKSNILSENYQYKIIEFKNRTIRLPNNQQGHLKVVLMVDKCGYCNAVCNAGNVCILHPSGAREEKSAEIDNLAEKLIIYLLSVEKGVSIKYLNECVQFFVYIMNYANKYNLTEMTIADAEELIVEATINSISTGNSPTLRSILETAEKTCGIR